MNRIYEYIRHVTFNCWRWGCERVPERGKCGAHGAVAGACLLLTLPALAEDRDGAIEEYAEIVHVQSSFQSPFTMISHPPAVGLVVEELFSTYHQWAQVNDSTYADATLYGDHSMVLGSNAYVRGESSVGYGGNIYVTGDYGTAIGRNALVRSDFGTAVGAEAHAESDRSIAIGHNAGARGNSSIALGAGAGTHSQDAIAIGWGTTASGTGSVTLGVNSSAGGVQALALGAGAVANARVSVALGQGAFVEGYATGAVALGSGSQASAANTVSVGNGSLRRSIVNVRDGLVGAESSEVVTGSQLHATNANVVSATNTANTARSEASSALSKVSLINGLIGQVSSGGAIHIGAQNNGTSLDIRNRIGGNRVVTGVAAGVVNSTSTDAVSGRQLYSTNQSLASVSAIANSAKKVADSAQVDAASALAEAGLLGKLVSQASDTSAVRLGGGKGGALIDIRNQAGNNRVLHGLADAALSIDSNDAVSGKQLHATNAALAIQQQSLISNTKNITSNRNDIDSNTLGVSNNRSDIAVLREDFDTYVPDMDGVVTYNDDRTVVGVEGALLTGIRAGDISSDLSMDAVTGGQLFSTNSRVDKIEGVSRYLSIGFRQESVSAQAGLLGVALGDSAKASLDSDGGTAIGAFSSALSRDSVALGRAAYVQADAVSGFALGNRSFVAESNGIAIGAGSEVKAGAVDSLALGYSSVADEANTLSIGTSAIKRRIVNVARGTGDTDATSIVQLKGALDGLGGGAGTDIGGDIIAPSYALNGRIFRNVGDALGALDVAIATNETSIESIDARFKRIFQEYVPARADGVARINLSGANGMVLGNISNGLVASGSRDAVNGGQLYAVQKELQGQIDGLGGRNAQAGRMVVRKGAGGVQTSSSSDSGDSAQPSVESTSSAVQAVEGGGDGSAAVGSEGSKLDVRGVARGAADSDAVSVQKLNDVVDRLNEQADMAVESLTRRLDGMDKRFNRMAAMSSAQSAMAMNAAGLQTYNRLGAGVGHADGESALAVGYQRVLNERGSATFSLNGAFTNSGERSLGVGVGIGW